VVLAKALQGNTSVRELRLRNNRITARGAKVLSERLCTNACAVRFVDLSDNNLGDDGGVAFALSFRDKKSRRNLMGVNLSGNSIGWIGAQAIADGIKSSSSIRTVDLSHNPIGAKGFEAIGNALQGQRSLVTLNLTATGLGKEGVRELAKGLRGNSVLQSLVLSNNPLGHEGGVELANVVPRMSSLSSLYLNDTGIFNVPHGADVSGLAGIFQLNKYLMLLSVSENHMTSETIAYLAEWICAEGHVLGNLNLQGCGIDDQGIQVLCSHLNDKNRRISLNIDDNPLTELGIQAIMAAVEDGSLRGETLTDSASIPLTDDDRDRLEYAERRNRFLSLCHPMERIQYNKLLSRNHSCTMKSTAIG